MTYFAFLALFLGIPLMILGGVTLLDAWRGKRQPRALNAWHSGAVIAALCLVALIYTTPWDNYLVATGVWYYNPALVTGIVIGYVPIEEYTFFIVLPVLTGLWTLLLMRNLPVQPARTNHWRLRIISSSVAALIWLAACVVLVLTFSHPALYQSWTYLALLLAWALIPIIIQLAFGADILWRHKWVVLFGIGIPTIYLSWADSWAIHAGTWTIDPLQSLPVFIAGVLPIEELVFFGIVNTLVVMGLTLVLAEESQQRAMALERFAVLRPLIRRTIGKWQSAADTA
jgi:lycopene cyclase domain-containing protein